MEAQEEEAVAKRRRVQQVAAVVGWVGEIEGMVEKGVWEVCEEEVAWDDVKQGWLSVKEVRAARLEEVKYMVGRGVWEVCGEEE